MTENDISNLIKNHEDAINNNYLHTDELRDIKVKVEEYLDENIKPGGRLYFEYRNLKETRSTLWTNAITNKPIQGDKYIKPWLELFDIFKQYIAPKKIKRRLEINHLWVQSNIEGDTEHLMVGDKENNGNKVHVIFGQTGEIRIDAKD